MADHDPPWVLWIDEIEKALSGGGADSTGVTTRLIGQFLFWLQESLGLMYVVACSAPVIPRWLRTARQPELEGKPRRVVGHGPETSSRRQDRRGQQMRVDESNAATDQAVIFDKDDLPEPLPPAITTSPGPG